MSDQPQRAPDGRSADQPDCRGVFAGLCLVQEVGGSCHAQGRSDLLGWDGSHVV